MTIKKNKSIDERISEEYRRLKRIYANLQGDKIKVVDGLIHRAAFMRITLEDYEEDIRANGSIEMFSQSEKTEPYERERPVVRLHIQTMKNYQTVIKQLAGMVPKAEETDDGFEDFISSREGY